LNAFDTQYMVQFTGPLAFGTNDNGFAPFQVSGGTYGNPEFSTMLVPQMLKENINALKARSIRNSVRCKSKINVMTYIPVLGLYVRDTPVAPQYTTSAGTFPLFDPPGPQQTINLIDGSIDPNTYVNLNGSYYQTKLSDYNFTISEFNQVLSKTSSICGDSGPPGLGCLYYTSVQKEAELSERLVAPKANYSKYVSTISNIPKAIVKTSSQKNVKMPEVIPPASLVTLTQNYTTTAFPVGAELQAFMDTIIVPTIRLDPSGTADQMSLQMYQIETREAVSTKYNESTNTAGGGTYSRLGKYAQLNITGVGHDSAGEYDSIMNSLVQHNQAGFLSGILGGLAKTILPADMHGIVDTISDIVPF